MSGAQKIFGDGLHNFFWSCRPRSGSQKRIYWTWACQKILGLNAERNLGFSATALQSGCSNLSFRLFVLQNSKETVSAPIMQFFGTPFSDFGIADPTPGSRHGEHPPIPCLWKSKSHGNHSFYSFSGTTICCIWKPVIHPAFRYNLVVTFLCLENYSAVLVF